jgi:adenylate cyclase
MYGNVGAQDRLDFTVIGPAVNLCARLQTLAGEQGEAIICSADFALHSGALLRSIGRHALKNIEAEVEAFVPGA